MEKLGILGYSDGTVWRELFSTLLKPYFLEHRTEVINCSPSGMAFCLFVNEIRNICSSYEFTIKGSQYLQWLILNEEIIKERPYYRRAEIISYSTGGGGLIWRNHLLYFSPMWDSLRGSDYFASRWFYLIDISRWLFFLQNLNFNEQESYNQFRNIVNKLNYINKLRPRALCVGCIRTPSFEASYAGHDPIIVIKSFYKEVAFRISGNREIKLPNIESYDFSKRTTFSEMILDIII